MYYKVQAKCGHVGKNYYILKWFFIKSESKKTAAKTVRFMPRVKHHQKDAIRQVIEIDFFEYIEGIVDMSSDLYFLVHNSTDQRFYNCVNGYEIIREIEEKKYKKNHNGQRIKNRLLDRESLNIIRGGYTYERYN